MAEVWHYPDGSRVLELSTKTTPDDAFPLAAKLRAFLGDHGVELTGSQQTKTRKALEFFAAALQGDYCGSPAALPRGADRASVGVAHVRREPATAGRRGRDPRAGAGGDECRGLPALEAGRRVGEGAREHP